MAQAGSGMAASLVAAITAVALSVTPPGVRDALMAMRTAPLPFTALLVLQGTALLICAVPAVSHAVAAPGLRHALSTVGTGHLAWAAQQRPGHGTALLI